MAVLKIKDPSDPTGATWIDITTTGTQGPAGGAVPTGGNPGEVLVKTGPADMEVGWAVRPRVALSVIGNQVTSHATVNTLETVATGEVDVVPDRYYHIFAGVRCIQDPGAAVATAQALVELGTIDLAGYDVWTTPDTGLFGSWSQNWLKLGSVFTATPATLTCNLRIMLSVASKIIYAPRLYVIEY